MSTTEKLSSNHITDRPNSNASISEVVLIINSSGEGISGTLDSSYYKGQGERQGIEREYVVFKRADTSLLAAMGEGEGYIPMIVYEAHQHQKYRASEITSSLTTDQNQHVRGDTPLVVEVRNGRKNNSG